MPMRTRRGAEPAWDAQLRLRRPADRVHPVDITFDFDPASGAFETVSLDFGNATGSVATQFDQSFVTNYVSQDGFASGTLSALDFDENGKLNGVFTNGVTQSLAQIALANFGNVEGLSEIGRSQVIESVESGPPVLAAANSGNLGSIRNSSLEKSNVDLAQQFVNLIVSQRAFRANTRTVSIANELLANLVSSVVAGPRPPGGGTVSARASPPRGRSSFRLRAAARASLLGRRPASRDIRGSRGTSGMRESARAATWAACALVAFVVNPGVVTGEERGIDHFDVVVLDAGHGGHDEGATGPSGLREKDLVLTTRRLKKRLERRGVKVILTRDGTFIPLEERTSVANDARADLFVSIHARRRRAQAARYDPLPSLDASDDAARAAAEGEHGLRSSGVGPRAGRPARGDPRSDRDAAPPGVESSRSWPRAGSDCPLGETGPDVQMPRSVSSAPEEKG